MAETYTLHVAGLTRELTICKVNDHMDIAAFIMLGDAELTVAAAAELLKKCPDFDILLTAEAKGIPLAHEMSRQSGKPYICARKGVKLYMPDPVVVEDQSITTAGKQKLVIDRKELEKMNGKRVLVVHPFKTTIERQYARRAELFPGTDILPQFADLRIVQAVQGLAGADTGYASWFDALVAMEQQMDAAPYDVAIIGAGAYGLPLAAHARDTGHAAIQMSGALQLLFGIRGKRWDDHPIISKLYNDAWVRPEETLAHKEKVEGGSYW